LVALLSNNLYKIQVIHLKSITLRKTTVLSQRKVTWNSYQDLKLHHTSSLLLLLFDWAHHKVYAPG